MSKSAKTLGSICLVLLTVTCNLAFGQHMRGGHKPGREEGGGGQVNPAEIINGLGGLIGGLGRLNQGGGGGEEEDEDDGWYEPDYYPSQPMYTYPPPFAPSVAPAYVPSAPPAAAAPPANKVPSQKTSISAPTKTNSKFLPKAARLTNADLEAAKAGLEKKVAGELKDAVDAALPSSAVATAVAALPTPPYTTAEKLQIRDAINAGDAGQVAILSHGPSPELDKVKQMAEVHEKANALQEKVAAGEATTSDFRKFQNELEAVAPASAKQEIGDSIATLKVQNEVASLLNTAVPGNGSTTLPLDSDLQLISLPGLPQGQLISLGNGSAIVGGGANGILTVSTGNPLGSFGVAVAPGTPVPSGSGSATTSGTLLSNPAGTDSSISYLLNGSNFTMQAGYQQPLAAGTTWSISFDQGNGRGTHTQTLGNGTYEFAVENDIWVLQKKQMQIEIDNRDNSIDFHYVIGASNHVVRAGESATHSGDSNITLAFDNGAGKTETKSLASGTYRVGVTDDGSQVDLFTGEKSSQVVETPSKRASSGSSKIGSLFGR